MPRAHARLVALPSSERAPVIATLLVVTAALHFITPAGPHSWHWLHLVLEQLFFVPILLAAAWLGPRGTLLTALAASALFAAHVLWSWQGFAMVQAEDLSVIATFWLVAIVAARLFETRRRSEAEVRVAHAETLHGLSGALELREHATAGHSDRVRVYALILARELGLTEPSFLAILEQGALLHDIGKIGIPDRVLLKGGSLAPDERDLMRRHPDLGAGLVGEIDSLGPVRELIRAHHERFDGSGYPRGLRGEEIPLAARIFSVVDVLDALTTDRPYHQAISLEEALDRIRSDRGTAFDPEVVDTLSRIPIERWREAARR